MDFGEIPAQRVDVRGVVHRPAEDDGGGLVGGGGGIVVKIVRIDSVGDHLQRHVAADVFPDKHLIIGTAENLAAAAAGDSALVEPEFGHVLPGEEFFLQRAAGEAALLGLELEIDAAAIDDERDVAVLAEEVLGEDDVADVDGVVGLPGHLLADDAGEFLAAPVADRRGRGAEEAFRKEFVPLRMREGHETHLAAELLEDWRVLEALAVFAEGDEVDGVPGGESAQEVEGALVGAAVERIRDVGINDEQVHVCGVVMTRKPVILASAALANEGKNAQPWRRQSPLNRARPACGSGRSSLQRTSPIWSSSSSRG